MIISVFGISIALGFFTLSFLLWRKGRAMGFDEEKMIEFAVWIGAAALLGGRAIFVFNHLDDIGFDILKWIHLRRYPGLNLWGALFLAGLAIFWFSHRNKIKTRQIVEIFYLLDLKNFFAKIIRRMKNFQFPRELLSDVAKFLNEKRHQLEKRLVAVKKSDPFMDKSRLIDNAAVDTEAKEDAGRQLAEAFQREINRNLARVRKAMTKIKIGKYGLCERCGKMIDTDRLAVLPDAEFCIECEKKKK